MLRSLSRNPLDWVLPLVAVAHVARFALLVWLR